MENPNHKIIVLVEDEVDLRTLYEEVLVDAGFDVKAFAEGDTALKFLQNSDWDLLLLDIMIPGKDGITILKELKEDENAMLKPIVLLTVLDNENIINEGFQHGAAGYLIKSSIDPDKIIEEVNSYLDDSENL
jgi:DNA-binding response OmpR family regulator